MALFTEASGLLEKRPKPVAARTIFLHTSGIVYVILRAILTYGASHEGYNSLGR